METSMSYVDFEPKPRPQAESYGQNPRPYGRVAAMKRVLNIVPDFALKVIPDLINASIAATGAPPSTEEEAFRYNLVRDRGIASAFDAASTFSPAAPARLVTAVIPRLRGRGAVPPALGPRPPAQPNASVGYAPNTHALPPP